MKIEHITFGGSAFIRDTNDIYSETVEHFKTFQGGCIEEEIKDTPFTCKVTVQDNIAIFDLKIKDDILCTNFCCFAKGDKEPVMLYVNDLASKIAPLKVLTAPHEDMFLYTIIINPFAGIGGDVMPIHKKLGTYASNATLAGEIELYIYDAIRRGIK
jgi:hypothetical protein